MEDRILTFGGSWRLDGHLNSQNVLEGAQEKKYFRTVGQHPPFVHSWLLKLISKLCRKQQASARIDTSHHRMIL